MKTIVGVDLAGEYNSALEVCLAMEIPGQEIVFVNAIEPVPVYAPPMPDILPTNVEFIEQLRIAGEEAVAKAAQSAARRRVANRSEVLVGIPAAVLMSVADGEKADLIAVSSQRKSGLSGLLMGSIARALTIASTQSLLITKDGHPATPSMHAVLATDHSAYANRAFDRLLEWAPKGLVRIDVLTSFQVDEGFFITSPHDQIDVRDTITEALEANLREKGEALALRLKAAGYSSKVVIERGYPNDVLRRHMTSCGADLMIVGAQGHGFFERLMVGSTALHQVTKEPYPVLVIRP